MSEKINIRPSSKTGSGHWLMQRFTALALVFLVIWLVFAVIQIAINPSLIKEVFSNPFNAVLAIIFFAVSLYHGSLGMRVIIEDYIVDNFKKNFYIILVNFISVLSVVAAILAILKIHF